MKKYYFAFIILILTLSACSQSPKFDLYEGKSLRIGVLGEAPSIREEQVRFQKISFDNLKKEELDSYDAIFIMKENLSKASGSQYADIYMNSPIPSFFISANSHLPFINKDLKFGEAHEWAPGTSYAIGFIKLKEDDSLKSWDYGLYNGEKTDEHVKGMYSGIFKSIEELQ